MNRTQGSVGVLLTGNLISYWGFEPGRGADRCARARTRLHQSDCSCRLCLLAVYVVVRRWFALGRVRRTSMPLLEVRGLVKWYGRRKVVDGVNFEVEAGEIVGLLGP